MGGLRLLVDRPFRPAAAVLLVIVQLFAIDTAIAQSAREETPPDSGRGGFTSSSPRRGETVVGALTPERREPGPRNDLASPDCASNSSNRTRRGCSQAAHDGGPHQGSDSFKGGPGCSIQCITSGVAYARGVGAELVIKTDTAATFFLLVQNEASEYSEYRTSEGSPPSTTWSSLFDDLQPDTTYQVWAWAMDSDDNTSEAMGSFTTLRRFARVEFGGFDIDDHASCCDSFRFHFYAHGLEEPEDLGWWPELAEWRSSPTLPATLDNVRSVAFDDAHQWMEARVQVIQGMDGGAPGCLEANQDAEPRNAPFGTSDPACPSTWATASVAANIDSRPANATSWTHHVWQFDPESCCTDDSALQFTAPISIEVRYAQESPW